MKKITGIIAGIVVLATIAVLLIPSDVPKEDGSEIQEIQLEADVIMPTKVSRPGCEETDSCYLPPKIVIKKGEEVTWINKDAAFHSVTSGSYDLPTELFDSGHLDPYELFSVTFDESGVFDYYCTLHPWMEGQVIVE